MKWARVGLEAQKTKLILELELGVSPCVQTRNMGPAAETQVKYYRESCLPQPPEVPRVQ